MSTPTGNEPIGAESQIRPAPDVIWRRVDDSVILVHLGTNKTYELNRTGGRLWELLEQGSTYSDALAAVGSEFEIGTEQLRAEAARLVARLLDEHLAEEPQPTD